DEGRFTGAVLAKHGMDAPGIDGEGSLHQRMDTAIALAHALHTEDRSGLVHPFPHRDGAGGTPGARACSPADTTDRPMLLVGLRLPHDFLCGEVDAAGREGIADEEIVRLVGVVVLAVLEVGIFDDGERQLDRLRYDLA